MVPKMSTGKWNISLHGLKITLSQETFLGPWPAQTLESGLSIENHNGKSGLQSLSWPGSQKCLLGNVLLFQLPLTVPVIMAVISFFLVIAPLVNEIRLEYVYSIVVLAVCTIIYFPFVHYTYKFPGTGR